MTPYEHELNQVSVIHIADLLEKNTWVCIFFSSAYGMVWWDCYWLKKLRRSWQIGGHELNVEAFAFDVSDISNIHADTNAFLRFTKLIPHDKV